MTPPIATARYIVRARTLADGVGEIDAESSTIEFDRSWNPTLPSDLPGPGELLAAAFAACIIKNVERFSGILPFAYRSAEISVELFRQDSPPCFNAVDWVLRLESNEPDHRVDLLARNLKKHGTVYNTLAATCAVTGSIETWRS